MSRKIIDLLIILVATILFLQLYVSCSSSLVEQNIRSKIPESYRNYNGGIIANPSERDINEAIRFGKACKEKTEVLEYAYIYKPNLNTYIFVRTPLSLIAQHALQRAQEYREVDEEFIKYARSIGAVKIEFGHHDDPNFSQLGIRSPVILLRDGVRVEPLHKLRIYKGENPYDKPINVDQAVQQVIEAGQQAMQSYYNQMGFKKYPDSINSETNVIELPENFSYFAIEDLKKPGKYEVIARRVDTRIFSGSQTKEERHVIDLHKFK